MLPEKKVVHVLTSCFPFQCWFNCEVSSGLKQRSTLICNFLTWNQLPSQPSNMPIPNMDVNLYRYHLHFCNFLIICFVEIWCNILTILKCRDSTYLWFAEIYTANILFWQLHCYNMYSWNGRIGLFPLSQSHICVISARSLSHFHINCK